MSGDRRRDREFAKLLMQNGQLEGEPHGMAVGSEYS